MIVRTSSPRTTNNNTETINKKIDDAPATDAVAMKSQVKSIATSERISATRPIHFFFINSPTAILLDAIPIDREKKPGSLQDLGLVGKVRTPMVRKINPRLP